MRLALLTIAVLLVASPAEAQSSGESRPVLPEAGTATTPPPETGEVAESKWSFSFGALGYIVPDGRDYLQPTLTIDHEWLHLEARYNYEAIDTGSVWIGYNISFGDAIKVDFTPMIGGVFGDTHGVAPGYEISLAWRGLEFYTEGEFVFDTDDSSASFFYSWSELTYSCTDWFRAGVAAQRTKIRDEPSGIDIGPLIGLK